MATAKGIRGASGMKKEELVKKLLSLSKKKTSGKTGASSKRKPTKAVSIKSRAVVPKATAGLSKSASRGGGGGTSRSGVANKSKTPTKPTSVAATKSAPAKLLAAPKSSAKMKVGANPNVRAVPVDPRRIGATTGGGAKSKVAKSNLGVASVKSEVDAKNAPAVLARVTTGTAGNSAGRELGPTTTSKKISQPKLTAVVEKPAEQKARPTNPAVVGKIKSVQQQRAAAKDLAFFRQQLSNSEEPKKDRLILFVRDPYWLQAYWEVTSAGVARAKAALAEDWHLAVPVLRLLVNDEEGVSGSSEQVAREIKIHGGVNNWYLDVSDPPHTFRAVIGYLATGNRFHALAYSNVVHAPAPGTSDHIDHNWTDLIDNGDRVFSMSGGFDEGGSIALREVFEEKLSRPMTRSALSRYGTSDIPDKASIENFFVDAELLIFGKTHRSSEVTISGEPVKLRDDGSFTVRVGLPDKRQVFPVSSTSFDGTFTYTTVLAIERNTKVMEPMSMEPGEDF